jgi:type IV secretion system protein VirB10
MRRLNRLPIIVAAALALIIIAVVIFGLSWRGLGFGKVDTVETASGGSATSFADQLKRGIGNAIIKEPVEPQLQPAPQATVPKGVSATPLQPQPTQAQGTDQGNPGQDWRQQLKREEEEQYLREESRQRMARLQAQSAALGSPLKVDTTGIDDGAASGDRSRIVMGQTAPRQAGQRAGNGVLGVATGDASAASLYATALNSGMVGGNSSDNGQAGKEAFLNQSTRDPGYLAHGVIGQRSPFELKRGSVIPATMITGLNSDLPGRILAQVSQNVYDSATGNRLLIPQGAKLFGRYDSRISFGQDRALVVWTDIVFPNGATLQIDGMAGTDAEGFGGFADKVDRHLVRTFGSAALIALIGTGIDMAVPQSSTLATQDSASDAARRNFADAFGRTAEQTISKNLNVQPTITIRPGYIFNVLVDRDIQFPTEYRANR